MKQISRALWVAISARMRDTLDDERGLTTTEVAVLTFILVAIAVAIGGVIYQYASDTVSGNPAPTDLTPNIPD